MEGQANPERRDVLMRVPDLCDLGGIQCCLRATDTHKESIPFQVQKG